MRRSRTTDRSTLRWHELRERGLTTPPALPLRRPAEVARHLGDRRRRRRPRRRRSGRDPWDRSCPGCRWRCGGSRSRRWRPGRGRDHGDARRRHGTEVGAAAGVVGPLLHSQQLREVGHDGELRGVDVRGDPPDPAGAEVGLAGHHVRPKLGLVRLGVGAARPRCRTPRWRRGRPGSSAAASSGSSEIRRAVSIMMAQPAAVVDRAGPQVPGVEVRAEEHDLVRASHGRGCRRRRSPSRRRAATWRAELQPEGDRLARGDLGVEEIGVRVRRAPPRGSSRLRPA